MRESGDRLRSLAGYVLLLLVFTIIFIGILVLTGYGWNAPLRQLDQRLLVERGLLVFVWMFAFFVSALILHRNNVLKRKNRAEERYGLLFRNIAEGVVLIECLADKNGLITNYRVCEVNEAAAGFIGKSAEWMLGRTGDEIYDVECAPYLDKVNEVFNTRKSVSFDHLLVSRNRWFRFNLVPAGQMRQAAIITDITDIIRATEELRQNEERLRQIFDSVSDAIMMHDEDGVVMEVNAQMLRMFSISREQALLLVFQLDISDRNNEFDLLPGYWARAVAGETITFEWNARRPGDGLVFNVEIVLHPIQYRERNIILATIRDISDRKRKDKENTRLEKMESVGMLAGGIAHDFNNILTGIIGNLNLAKMDVSAESELGEILNETADACLKAKKLVDTFMEFAKTDEISRDDVELNGLLAALCAESGAGERIAFVQRQEFNPVVSGDREQLRRALRHLLQNAVDATAVKGDIVMETLPADAGLPAALPDQNTGYVMVIIRDSGYGIAAADMSKVFNPYYSTKDNVTCKGVGFGLPIAHNIIKRHKGIIHLDSVEGKGTVCTVFLPLQGYQQPDRVIA